MKRRRGWQIALLLFLLTAVTLIYVRSRVEVMQMNMALAEALRQQRELERENQRLRIATERKMTPARLELAASRNRELFPAAESQVILIEEEVAK